MLRPLFLAAFTLAPLVLPAQKLTAPADAKTRVSAIFARYNHTDAPGCSLGVGIDGDTVLTAAFGMADLEHRVALTPSRGKRSLRRSA